MHVHNTNDYYKHLIQGRKQSPDTKVKDNLTCTCRYRQAVVCHRISKQSIKQRQMFLVYHITYIMHL